MNLAQELETVLQKQKQCLLSGDFAGLSILVERKARLSDQLAVQDASAEFADIANLAKQARQNDALLQSALRGTKAALVLIREASNGADKSTYTENGNRRPMGAATINVEQKM